MSSRADTSGMQSTDASLFLQPPTLDASPRGPLIESWPEDTTSVCVLLRDGTRLLVGPHDRWVLVEHGRGRVATGWIEAA